MHSVPLRAVTFLLLLSCALLTLAAAADEGNTTAALPDLQVTAIASNGGEVFAHEPNTITATIKNAGTGSAGAFKVRFRIDGTETQVSAAGIASGATLQVDASDTATRMQGASVTINVMADPEGVITETDKTNNALEVSKSVVNNGYKGKRFSDGSDMKTQAAYTLRGDLFCSAKPEYQGAGTWGSRTVTWSSSEASFPANYTIRDARLYVPYNWDTEKIMPGGVTMTFNGKPVSAQTYYTDTKGYGGYDYPSGLLVYSVTSEFLPAGPNTATIVKTSPAKGPALNGMILVVVYENPAMTRKQIFITEEADILKRYESDTWITPGEATTIASFSGPSLELSEVTSARLITIANSARPGEGILFFNSMSWTGIWTGGDDTTLGFDDRQVKGYLKDSENTASFQAGVSGDYFVPTNAILVVEYKGTAATPVVVTSTSAVTPLSANTTATSNVSATHTPAKGATAAFRSASSSRVVIDGDDEGASASVSSQDAVSGTQSARSPYEGSANSLRISGSDILVPLPLALAGALVLVNTLVAAVGIILIFRDLKHDT